MNKRDLITDARNQITLAKINLADEKDMAAIENLRAATLQISRFNNLIRAPKPKTPPARGIVVTPHVRRLLGKTRRMP